MNNNSTYYQDMLDEVRGQILENVKSIVEKLGGKICTEYYHGEKDCTRYTFFAVDDDGHGVELFVSSIETEDGKLVFNMSDSEDSYNTEWELWDFDASNALYLLQDLEEIAEYIEESGEEVETEYPDYL